MSRPAPATPTMARAMASASRYHQWVFGAIAGYLRPGGSVLEVGAGHEGYTSLLRAVSMRVIATDVDPKAVDRLSDRLSACDGIRVVRMDGIETGKIDEPVDTVVAINIIEHIEDDRGFVKNCFEVLGSGGRLIIFAPAFPFLFANMDAEAGHFRRYSKAGLKALLEESGFEIAAARYFNFIGFWGWLFNKFFQSGVDSRATNAQVRIFDRCVRLFRLFDLLTCFCGQSVVVVGERPQANGIRGA